MAINYTGPKKYIGDRFGIAQDAPIQDDAQSRQIYQREIRTRIYLSAKYIANNVTQSREQDIALERLEEALMWAGKAIFKD